MKNYGFFRIMTASPDVSVGDTGFCFESIKNAIDKATAEEASLLVLPELCVTSASCGDLFLTGTLLNAAERRAEDIAKYTEGKDMLVCFSFPLSLNGDLYSVAALAADGEIIGIVPLEAEGVFSDYSGDDTVVSFAGKRVPFGKGLLFRSSDNSLLSLAGGKQVSCSSSAVISMIPDASMEQIGSRKKRRDFVSVSSLEAKNATVYASSGNGESTAKGVYSGHCMIAEEGKILSEAEPFSDGYTIADVDLQAIDHHRRRDGRRRSIKTETDVFFRLNEKDHETVRRKISALPFVPDDTDELHRRCLTAFEIQSRGLAERLKKTGIGKAVIGISGGLDSTAALLASVRAMELLGMDNKDVIAVSMPCFGTSSRTKSNAEKLCEALDVDFRIIDITEAVRIHLENIGHDAMTADAAYENAQARERTQVLMDIANMENGLVVGTGDLSEAALGWCTFNGDHMSMYNVNCSLPKTFLRAAVTDYAENCGNEVLGEVLRDVVATPISPELKPTENDEISQKTEDIIGPYGVHDFLLFHFVRDGYDPRKLLYLAGQVFRGIYSDEQLESWVSVFFRRFFSSQFKRNCVPEGPVIGSVNLSSDIGFSMPGDVSRKEFLY